MEERKVVSTETVTCREGLGEEHQAVLVPIWLPSGLTGEGSPPSGQPLHPQAFIVVGMPSSQASTASFRNPSIGGVFT